MNVRHRVRHFAAISLFFAFVAFGSACDRDEGTTYSVFVTVDRSSLLADGSDSTLVFVTVLDQNSNPAPFGTRVTLATAGGGNINSTGENVAQADTAPEGIAEFRLSCTGSDPIALLATAEGQRGNYRGQIECRPAPSGNWRINVTADPRRINTGSGTTIIASATDENGNAVPRGTSLDFSISSGEGRFSGGASSVTRGTEVGGQARLTLVGGNEEGTTTVCAQFSDSGLSGAPACVAVTISDRVFTDAACIGAVSTPRVPADGRTVSNVTVTVSDRAGATVQGARVDLEIANGDILDAPNGDPIGTSISDVTDANGDLVAFVRAPTVPGTADLVAVARFTEDGAERTLPCEFSENLLYFGPPSCQFVDMTPQILGVLDSGIAETGRLRFCFTAGSEAPVAARQRVNFSWDVQIPGTELAATSALTDGEGCVEVEINTGTLSGLARVRARLAFGDSESTCTSEPLPVRGGRPTEDGWNLQCETSNVSAEITREGDEILSNCGVRCWSYLRDRWGNPVDRPEVQVFFAAEQGTIVSPVSPDANGRVETIYRPNGGLPARVPPLPGEPRYINAATGDSVNPRDMLVTIISWTNGEEAFEDANGNGFYDEGEVWVDRPEPFIDSNDNDTFDPEFPFSEQFFDVATPDRPLNRQWDDVNGRWDANTVIWNQTAVVLSGNPVAGTIAPGQAYVPDPSAPDRSPPFFSYYLVDGTQTPFGSSSFVDGPGATIPFYAVDLFLNAPGNHVGFSSELVGCQGTTVNTGGSTSVTNRGFNYYRELQGFDSAGRPATGTNVEHLQWVTRMPEFEVANSRLEIGRAFFANLSSVGGGRRCTLNTTFSSTESSSCTDLEVRITYPHPLDM